MASASSGWWLQSIRSGLSLRSRTRTTPCTFPPRTHVGGQPVTVALKGSRWFQTQAMRESEDDDEEDRAFFRTAPLASQQQMQAMLDGRGAGGGAAFGVESAPRGEGIGNRHLDRSGMPDHKEEVDGHCGRARPSDQSDSAQTDRSQESSFTPTSLAEPRSPAVKAALLAIRALSPSSPAHLPTSTIESIFQALHDELVETRRKLRREEPVLADHKVSLPTALSLLSALQSIRRPRTLPIYHALISHCMLAGRPDLAATVYVGWVEEWIMEGRVAEGADWMDFREGGGPRDLGDGVDTGVKVGDEAIDLAQAKEMRKASAAERNDWFQGVREWRFPGEDITPSQRLDLWHPKKLALHEKLRGFPMPSPTSPPTLVPQPNLRCLKRILAGLQLHHTQRESYTRSARALAMLANTVIARTLPVTGLSSLVDAFRQVQYSPEVFPEGFTPPPDCSDTYPFTAYAHTYRALMSLVLIPPPLVSSGLAALYKLQPLTTHTANRLLHWVMVVMKRPFMGKALLKMVEPDTTTFNILMRGATIMRENKLADGLRKMLFRKKGGEARVASVEVLSEAVDESARPGYFETNSSLVIPRPGPSVLPDDFSLSANISHMIATSQFDELEKLLYEVYPYLDTASYPAIPDTMTPELVNEEHARRAKLVDQIWKHDGHVFAGFLNGFKKAGKITLAERIYEAGRFAESRPGARKKGWHLPIHAYTTMLDLYADARKKGVHIDKIEGVEGQGRPLWGRLKFDYTHDPAYIARRTSERVFREAGLAVGLRRFHVDAGLTGLPWPQPDQRFLEAFLRPLNLGASAPTKGTIDLQQDPPLAASMALFELDMVIHIAQVWQIEVPNRWMAHRQRLQVLIPELMEQEAAKREVAVEQIQEGLRPNLLAKMSRAYLWPEYMEEAVERGWLRTREG